MVKTDVTIDKQRGTHQHPCPETLSRWIQQQKQRRDEGWFSDKNNRNNNEISSLDVNLGTQISATEHVRFAYKAWR
ncbi:hypothetical protein DPMN_012683 [Dreissena polymorpha]|uniref:Uncharacterized protein n=1 Tax=Dreissena polymorpha TaxID=45954 RepID=A0A9D4S318_DREPO|nr:hypothetical protein DPMN_012683 [Dreissena polymorpha]